MSIIDTVKNTIAKHDMLAPKDRVLVGVSGGADSMCLLSVLRALDIDVHACHLNHGLRGAEADGDEAFVKEFCEKINVPCTMRRVYIENLAKERGLTVEEAGRAVRYDFFKEIAEKTEAAAIATAHNRDDQAETVLMRMLRGTGLTGLCGIKHVRGDGVVRPLLDVTRAEIEAYLSENGISFRTDSTNLDTAYTRNKIRAELLPYITENYNVNIIEALAGLAENVAADVDFIEGYAQRLYKRLRNPLPKHKPTALHVKSLRLMEPAIFMRLIKIAAREEIGRDPKLEKVHYEAIADLVERRQNGASLDLPNKLKVRIQEGWIYFEQD